MKNLTAILYLTLALFILSACGDYEKGAAAYKEGNHATALNVFQPLAENKGFLSLFYSKEDVINAQFNLGVMYEIGQGVPQDDKTAVKWYRLAAEQGHAGAQSNLKILQEKIAEQQPSPTVTAEKPPTPPSGDFQKGIAAYESGDYATALREWKPLAEQGNADAQVHLGGMYTLGKGVPKDYKTAVKWYSLAAEQGHSNAQYNLGWMYRQGRGVPQNDKTAVKWYRLAAEQGHADAQSNLGAMYALKQGVVQDNIYAHMWGHLGASNGNETGGKVRDFVEKKMTPADISTAQKLARECVRKKYKGC
jgi:TPR repeat protein